MNISMNMALTMARPPQPPTRSSSLRTFIPLNGSDKYNMESPDSVSSQFSLYKGISERPLGWKRLSRDPELRSRNMNIRRWDGAARTSKEWDGLRKVSAHRHFAYRINWHVRYHNVPPQVGNY
jgi:hypothetical protein